MRQKARHLFRLTPDQPWQRCDTLVPCSGQQAWLTHIELTQQHPQTCNLLALWQPGEKVPC